MMAKAELEQSLFNTSLLEDSEENFAGKSSDGRILNYYRINFRYLLDSNERELNKILNPTQLKELEQNLTSINDKELSNHQIVQVFSDEYLKIIKKIHQSENRNAEYDQILCESIETKDSMHVIWGNCFDVLKRMEAESIGLMVTSPPYYNAREYAQWENIDYYLEDMRKIIRESYRVLDNHRVWVWNVGDIFDNDRKTTTSVWGKRRIPLGAYFTTMFEEEGFTFVDDYIWDKGEVESKRHMNNGMNYPFYQYPLNCYEHILIFHKHRLNKTKIPCPVCGSLKVNGNTQSEIGVQSWECKNEKCFVRSPHNRGKRFSRRTNMMQYHFENDEKNNINKDLIQKWRRDIVPFSPVIKINSSGENRAGHSAPFPEDIPEMAVKYFSYADDKVLDPFAGSFTTPIVAHNLGRKGIGIELNKTSYRDIILERVKNSKGTLFNIDREILSEYDVNPQ
jgi:DNA modification methylase